MTDENTQGESPAQDAIAPENVGAESSPAPEDTSPQTETPDDAGQPQEEKKPSWAQKRIDELTRNWREEQRRTDALTQALLANRVQIAPEEKPVTAQPAKLPTLEEFGYDEAKYQAAFVEYAKATAKAEVRAELEAERNQRAEQARAETFVGRAREYAKANPDFMDVLQSPTLPISESVQDLAKDLENGPELIHWLVKNPQEADRLMRLPERLQAFEAGRIADRLESKKSAAMAPAPAKPAVTKAPPPPPTVEAADVPMEKSQEDMSADEWMRWREKQLTRKRKT